LCPGAVDIASASGTEDPGSIPYYKVFRRSLQSSCVPTIDLKTIVCVLENENVKRRWSQFKKIVASNFNLKGFGPMDDRSQSRLYKNRKWQGLIFLSKSNLKMKVAEPPETQIKVLANTPTIASNRVDLNFGLALNGLSRIHLKKK
jgi:hypothetical protein